MTWSMHIKIKYRLGHVSGWNSTALQNQWDFC